ncbi:hypothetical protein N0V95_000329 [Ascochyta clinopodiicola]|nr:hypothetical protein N0V95_000329 [Ascochyta clinopodiicola]
MRKPSACSTCRARRRKCIYPTGTRHDRVIACEYCRSRALHCVQRPPEGGYYAQRQARIEEFEAGQQTSASPRGPPTPASSQSPSDLPPVPLRLELVNLYFDYIHDQFHSMYHRPSFTEDVARERVPRIILLAVFALSSRFSSNSVYAEIDPRERGEGFRTASEALLDLRDISPVTIQACVLLGAYAAAHGDTDIENVYYSTAGRMCLVLDLPSRPVASLLEREVNIRVWWTVCMVDVWSSAAVKVPRIMPLDSTVSYPIDEIPFSSMSADFTSNFINNPATYESPILTEMIKLNRILLQVIDFNHSFVLDRWLLRFLVQFAPHMELEPRDNDPHYEALLALSKQSPLSCSSTSVT